MGTRLQLQTVLETILGSKNVYFQPPATIVMKYPCIVYSRSSMDTKFANNVPYSIKNRYQLTVIAKDPDSVIPGKVGALSMCVYDRHFTSDNLNHDIFNIYY